MIKNAKFFKEILFDINGFQKQLIKITFDSLAITLSIFLAFVLRLENIDFLYFDDFYKSCIIVNVSAILIFNQLGLYNAVTRHISIDAAIAIFFGTIGSAIFLYTGKYFLNIWLPNSVPFIYSILVCLLLASSRLLVRAMGQHVNQAEQKNVIIYGAGEAGTQLFKALKFNQKFRVCQFIDDNTKLHGQTISGIKIHGFKSAERDFKKKNIKIILMAMAQPGELARAQLSSSLLKHDLDIKTIPSMSDLIASKSKITELKDINIEALLGRSPVEPQANLMSKNISEKVVLVTGAGGSIGSELCRQILDWEPENLIILDISEFSIYRLMQEFEKKKVYSSVTITPLVGSVQDSTLINTVIDCFDVDTIYHAAAYKHVPLMEQNVTQCVSNNVFGTYNLAKKAIGGNVANFILVSTDKAVNPTNFMGASKRLAELVCLSFAQKQNKTNFSIVRFGNVLDSSGSVVPLFKDQIKKRAAVTVTHKDITRYFMTIPEAAQLVVQAGSIGNSGDVFVLDMGKPIKIYDLAEKMITLSGFKPIKNEDAEPNADEIKIVVGGLRPGEKLHEELAYSDNLTPTVHPRILKSSENGIGSSDLESLLSQIGLAIKNVDYNSLFMIIASVTGDISTTSASSDLILNKIKRRT